MISVIIPVYNVAPYLPACLDSVLAQSYADFELILVNDGSNDGSGEICNDYACRDARITVIHQANQGASAARNMALDVMQGEYVTFIDADDVVHARYLEVLHQVMNLTGSDVVQSPYQIIDSSRRGEYSPERLSVDIQDILCIDKTLDSGNEALLDMLYQRPSSANSSPCKLFRASLFDSLRFPEQYRVYEDLFLLAQLYPRMRRMTCLQKPLYYYFKDNRGTLNSQSIRRLDAFDMLETLEARFLVQGMKPLVRAVRERRLSVSFNILRLLSQQPHTDQNKAMAHRCWQHIKALRRESIHDQHARLKNRLVAALTYLINPHS